MAQELTETRIEGTETCGKGVILLLSDILQSSAVLPQHNVTCLCPNYGCPDQIISYSLCPNYCCGDQIITYSLCCSILQNMSQNLTPAKHQVLTTLNA